MQSVRTMLAPGENNPYSLIELRSLIQFTTYWMSMSLPNRYCGTLIEVNRQLRERDVEAPVKQT